MSPTTTTTYYHCDSCREMKTGNFHKCYVCQKILCPRCNMWGLCPDHFVHLSSQHQNDLQTYDREYARASSLSTIYGGVAGGFLCGFILTTIILCVVVYTSSRSSADTKIWTGIALGAMWGPGFLLIIRGFWKAGDLETPRALALLAIFALLQQYPGYSSLDLPLTPTKATETLHARKLLPADGSTPPVQLTPPFEVAVRPFSFKGTTGKCWTCGEVITMYTEAASCFQCGAFLCKSCHKLGLCPDHLKQLSPGQTIDMQTCFEERQGVKKQYDRPAKTWVLPSGIVLEVGFMILIPLAFIFKDPITISLIIIGIVWSFIVGFVVRAKHRHLQPILDRANLAIKALLDDIPSVSQTRPICQDSFLLRAKEDMSGETGPAEPTTPEALETFHHANDNDQHENAREIPFLNDAQAISHWKDLVATKFPCLYCPDCKADHPAFARFCIFCGKPLPKSD